MLGYTDLPPYVDLSLNRSDRRPTLPTGQTDDSDNDCRQYLVEDTPVKQTDTVSNRPNDRTYITDSLSEVTADVRLSQGTRSADDIFEPSPDVPTAEYRHIVSQSVQTSYNRYGLLSCQGYAVRLSWGIVLPRTWVNYDDLITHTDLTAPSDLTTLQLSAPLMTGPYRILL